MTDQIDFPAAHSMDSSWFAVDGNGHVALFHTGEAGCMPNSIDYESLENEEGIVASLDRLSPESGIEYFFDDLATAADGQVFQFSWRTQGLNQVKLKNVENVYSAILWLKDESLFSDPKNQPPELFGKNPATYAGLRRLPNKKYILAQASGINKAGLQNVISKDLVNRTWVGLEVELHRLGFFVYSHGNSFENWIAGPFVKENQAINPVNFEDLPDHFKKVIGNLRFQRAQFLRDHAVDAHEFDECSSWGTQFVSLTGVVKNYPGQE